MIDKELNDSGDRSVFGYGAMRDRGEKKGRFDLLPASAIARLAKHFQKGAEKYTRSTEFNNIYEVLEWLKLNVRDVEKISHIILETDVETVMKNGLEKTILNLLKDNEKTTENGQQNIQKQKRNILLEDKLIQNYEQETNRRKEEVLYEKEDLLKKLMIKSYNSKITDAQSVEESFQKLELSILTMIIKQGWHEEFYVVAATTGLECLRKVFQLLIKLFPTFKIQPQEIIYSNNRYIITPTGDRNWEKGMPIHMFFDSGLRHAFQYLDGDTSEDHLVAAAWNFMCAMWTEEHYPELVDIPTRPEYKERHEIKKESSQ